MDIINNKFQVYFANMDLDIRKSHYGRWMDQKVTPDVLSLVVQTLLDFSKNQEYFTNKDLFSSSDFLDTVSNFLGKPALAKNEMENEYNKFVGQQLKILSYAQLLNEDTTRKPFLYSVKNNDLLETIAQSDKKALVFLQEYICKVLNDSEFQNIYNFLDKKGKTNDDFEEVRDNFVKFEILNTGITRPTEPRRILAKVLNPLALLWKTEGAKGGSLSKEKIRYSDLMYNNVNFQDSKKLKGMSRQQYRKLTATPLTTKYRINKAIRAVREYNNRINDGLSEIGSGELATQGHHMLPKESSRFSEYADYTENIIMISPDEHFLKAHPNNNTHLVDRNYQKKLLMFKADRIIDAQKNHPNESPYDVEDFIEMIRNYKLYIEDAVFLDQQINDLVNL